MGGRGKGSVSSQGGNKDNIELLKKNLQETIRNAERTLNELDLEKGKNQRPQTGKGKKDTRGSKSLMDLSGQSVKLSNKVEKNTQPQGQSRGRGRGNSRGRGDNRVRGDSRERGGTSGTYDSKPPSLLGDYPQHPEPLMKTVMKKYPERNPYPPHAPPLLGEYHDPNYHSYGNMPPPPPDRYGNMHPPHYSYENLPPQPRDGYGNRPPPLHEYGNRPPPPHDGYRNMPHPPHDGYRNRPHDGYGNRPPPPHKDYGNMPPPPHDGYRNIPHPPHDGYGNRPPPPTYDESMKDPEAPFLPEQVKNEDTSKASPKKKGSKTKLTAEALVKALAIFRGQFETAETIGRQVESDPSAVVNFAKSRKDLFACMGEGKDTVIELVPKIALCSEYLSHDGCNSRETCNKLHMCKTYVTGFCDLKSACQDGHRFDTNHNNALLSKMYLDLIDRKTLHQIVRKIVRNPFKLQICSFYNSERGCKYVDSCSHLHICKSYVLGTGKCSKKECSLNHNIVAQQCHKLLKLSGVPVNESPRDVVMQLALSIEERSDKELGSVSGERNPEGKDKNVKPKKGKKENVKANNDGPSDESSDSESSDGSQDKGQQTKPRKKEAKKQRAKKTFKATDVHGDVEIPEICLFSIDDKCKNDKKGCKYLHAKSLFHWQVERNGKWYNFRIFQSKILENAYRDVAKGFIQVPALDESKLEDHTKELLNVLGTESWKADFQSMDMMSNNINLKIRRVSTQSSVISTNPKATVFEWYFKDDQGKWIQYGQVDSLGKQQLVCNISSEDIEKQYLSDPSSSMLICNAHYKYKLNFSKMTQVNEHTDKEREVRRRPSRLSYQKKPSESDPSSAIPVHWNQMAVNQTHLLVPLDSSSAEFQEVSGRLRLMLPTAIIQKIQRLQNPYLWRLLQYRKAALSKRYDDYQLNMQKLFHGISPQDIDTICKENFDWRQGITVKQSYGQGTYFSNSAAVARGHCTPDTHGRIFMFLAQVIIGAVVKGDPSYTRPPSNPSTNALYDTTVDDETAPTIFVKYDKEEYYPEYVIEFY